MRTDQVQTLKNALLDGAPESLTAEKREAMERLIADGSPDAIRALAEILSRNSDRGLLDMLVSTLRILADNGSVKPLYELWWATHHPRLTALLTEGGWIPNFASHLKVIRSLESGDLEPILDGSAEVIDPLVRAVTSADQEIRERAMRCLEALRDRDAIDALCAAWAENRSAMLRALIEQRGYVARKPAGVKVLSALASGRTEAMAVAGPEIAEPLSSACADPDPIISRRAKASLLQMKDEAAIDALVELWAHHRSPELGEAIEKAGYVARKPPAIRVLSALKCGRIDQLHDDGPDVVYPLIVATEDADPLISEAAKRLLDDVLVASEFQDELCRVVIQHGTPSALEIAVRNGYRPSDVKHRALFHFLTEQWDEYESLDFDMSILTELFEHGGKGLRSRIARTARRAGRLELVELVAGVRHKRRMGEMTVREWEVTLGILDDRRDWETTWRLAQSAPAVWSVKALKRLDQVPWRPGNEQDRAGFEDLLRLAHRCDSEAPILGMVDRPTARFTAHGRRVSRLIVNSYFDRTLASASWDGTVRIWSMPEGKPLNRLSAHRHPVSALAATPDGSVLASGSGAEDRVILWGMPDGESVKTLRGHERGVACLAVSPDGRLLAAGCHDGNCRMWRMKDGALLKVLHGSGESIRSVAFSPDGNVLATGGEDTVIRLWDVSGGEPLATLNGHRMTVRSLVFTPDGGMLISAGSDNSVLLWGMPDGELVTGLNEHTNVVTSLAVSGDGKLLAAASWDRTVRMWIMPEARPWGTLEEHTGPVTCLATDPESRMLVSGGHDCTVVMWNFQSGIFRRPTIRQDMDRIESLVEQPSNANEQKWLDFLVAQMRRRWRFDIEVDRGAAKIEVGEFDIEVEG